MARRLPIVWVLTLASACLVDVPDPKTSGVFGCETNRDCFGGFYCDTSADTKVGTCREIVTGGDSTSGGDAAGGDATGGDATGGDAAGGDATAGSCSQTQRDTCLTDDLKGCSDGTCDYCTGNPDCPSGYICDTPTGGSNSYCVKFCGTDGDCSGGTVCVGTICIDPCDGRFLISCGNDCVTSDTRPERHMNRAVCYGCGNDDDCPGTQVCVFSGNAGDRICAEPCNPADTACADGTFVCAEVETTGVPGITALACAPCPDGCSGLGCRTVTGGAAYDAVAQCVCACDINSSSCDMGCMCDPNCTPIDVGGTPYFECATPGSRCQDTGAAEPAACVELGDPAQNTVCIPCASDCEPPQICGTSGPTAFLAIDAAEQDVACRCPGLTDGGWYALGSSDCDEGIAPTARVSYSSVALDDSGLPWIAYQDANDTAQVKVVHWNGDAWVATPIGRNGTGTLGGPSIAHLGGSYPLVAWAEMDPSEKYRVYVALWTGTKWDTAGVIDGDPLNETHLGAGLTLTALTEPTVPHIAALSAGAMTRAAVVWAQQGAIRIRAWETNGWNTSITTLVEDGTTTQGDAPRVALRPDGRPVVTWLASNGLVLARRWTNSWLEIAGSATAPGVNNRTGDLPDSVDVAIYPVAAADILVAWGTLTSPAQPLASAWFESGGTDWDLPDGLGANNECDGPAGNGNSCSAIANKGLGPELAASQTAMYVTWFDGNVVRALRQLQPGSGWNEMPDSSGGAINAFSRNVRSPSIAASTSGSGGDRVCVTWEQEAASPPGVFRLHLRCLDP